VHLNFVATSNVVNLDNAQQDAIMAPSRKKRKKSSEISAAADCHKWTAQTFPMPQFSSSILHVFETNELFLNMKPFVRELGEHFKNVVDTSNSPKNIYPTYVAALMLNFPQIGDAAIKARKGKTDEGGDVRKDLEAEELDEVDKDAEETEPTEKEEKAGEQVISNEFGVSIFCYRIVSFYIQLY